ncbi:hypothetical protein DS909_14920 [Phaeobacter gallaeciensis]|uniref:Uncharacterized protein n=1 Tax=Phaeobacter gallaeciensis TaxID=60890 RepID=A0A366WVS0_9RHOB|nr:hypothetical protein DS909_14920 [Phaeobacter gallaeciensis]
MLAFIFSQTAYLNTSEAGISRNNRLIVSTRVNRPTQCLKGVTRLAGRLGHGTGIPCIISQTRRELSYVDLQHSLTFLTKCLLALVKFERNKRKFKNFATQILWATPST